MYLDHFLTEYDDTLSSESNIDPLGLLVIWSAFGQAIFHNRVNSISNDVRNYTLNLFNHYVIKSLVEDDSVVLGKGLQGRYDGKDDVKFKHACLIYLENLYTYSMVAAQDKKGVETSGVLGISNARRTWHERSGNPTLLFGHEKKSEVLVRQVMLGVSGRYKTPLMEMRFLDKYYRYDLPEGKAQWQKTARMIQAVPMLKKVFDLLRQHLAELISQPAKGALESRFDEIDDGMKSAYVKAFLSPASVGKYAKDFWLGLTDLDQGAAGALYQVLQDSMLNKGNKEIGTARLFALAEKVLSSDQATEKTKLSHIRQIEPLLTELDLMFTLMLSKKTQTLAEIVESWKKLGRDLNTLPTLSTGFAENMEMLRLLSATGKQRFTELLIVSTESSVEAQARALLAYHANVMEGRGQLPWIKLGGNELKLDVPIRKSPGREDRNVDFWVNSYYIPQFKNLVRGFWGIST